MTGGTASPEIGSDGSDWSVEGVALGMIDGNDDRVALRRDHQAGLVGLSSRSSGDVWYGRRVTKPL
ncbi:MAG TPA: hypothetical protein DDZ51_17830 [Planctomycetaceae bacterium]|nr:hypothetical protein [Planctomycetaceae bacterium]